MALPPIQETHSFPSGDVWEDWLEENAEIAAGIWMRLFKKNSGIASVTYAEALDGALCYGWIDGQKKSYDENSWLQRFVPRRPKSSWSRVNTQHVSRLMELGRMKPSGLRAVEAAKADGRWEAAYDSPAQAIVPPDLQHELDCSPTAAAFFEALDKQNRYAILYRIQVAKKPETRAKRIRDYIEMLEKGEKLHP